MTGGNVFTFLSGERAVIDDKVHRDRRLRDLLEWDRLWIVRVADGISDVNVRDTGDGICEEEQPKVFRRFYRSLEHSGEEGVGVGLYLVRQIAEGQGGYVKVSSQPGAGSTFSLYLPRK